jgi:transformation/transcription domain-associated protein
MYTILWLLTFVFSVAYDPNGLIEFNELVPFRLTRNMQAFFSNFGVEGLIVSAMCSAAQSVVSPKVSFPHQHAYI